MTFPVYFDLGPLRLHLHFVLEVVAYAVPLYWLFRRKRRPEVATGIASHDGIQNILRF